MTLEEKQAYFGNLGFRVARTTHYAMLTGLLRATDLDGAFAATCDLWWHQLTSGARVEVEEALETGRGPYRERQSRSLEPLFHWNGTTTVLGEAVLRWATHRASLSTRRAADKDVQNEPTDLGGLRMTGAAIDSRDIERILSEIHSISPGEFERLTANLALALGYADDPAKVKIVGQTADGGIDVIVNDDLLGTSPKIFIQAKRWKGSVGIAEVQRFGGILSSRHVPRGLLITPSGFTNDARRWAQHSPTVTLVDGAVLAAAIIRSGHSVDDLVE